MCNEMTKLETRNTKLEDLPATAVAPIRDFKGLDAWKLARALRTAIYVLFRRLPLGEHFALNCQPRRASQSIGANIAEGFGRYSYQENIQFCRQPRGSACEVSDHLVTAVDACSISKAEYDDAERLAQRVIQTLNGYIRSTTKRQAESRKAR